MTADLQVQADRDTGRVADDVPTLTRWAETFRHLAEADPVRCAGYLGAAQHLERGAESARQGPVQSDPDCAPGRQRVDLRNSPRVAS